MGKLISAFLWTLSSSTHIPNFILSLIAITINTITLSILFGFISWAISTGWNNPTIFGV